MRVLCLVFSVRWVPEGVLLDHYAVIWAGT